MKFVLICALFLPGFSALALSADEIQYERTCGSQVMAAVAAAHSDTSGTFKKIIFSKTDDKVFVDNLNQLKTLQPQFASTKDKAIAEKIKKVLDSSTELAKKKIPQELELCVSYFKTLTAETMKACPGVKENDPAYTEKITKCADVASKSPVVEGASTAWNKTLTGLILNPKK